MNDDKPTELFTPSPDQAETPSPAAPATKGTIGSYRIIGKLGEGGMGMVYEAEQQNPKRPVALKVIRGGHFVDDTHVRMFQREAQTLARLKHPSIAAIYESGRTDDGQHFFAMELVRGETLNQWLGKREAEVPVGGEIKLRLALFRKLCEGVAYAHQRGVVHRDLKPSNILVLRESSGSPEAGGEVPEIKILDFGLARITDTDVAASTLVTNAGAVQGTLHYMSPEQVRGNPDEIDLRTDVYSLGVMLYEILTGQFPYDVGSSTLYEAARVICETPPVSLSQGSGNGHRADRDLETIVHKALEKDPMRRYQSVTAFAEDIQRYLANHPILARPPSTVYQLRKMVARHKLGFAFAASTLLLLAAFAITMTIQAGLIARERDRANQEAETASRVSEFLVGLFEVSDPGEALGNTITAREILDEGSRKIHHELSDQPQVQARLMDTMGRVYRSLGLYDQARPLLEEALDILRANVGEQHTDVARTLENLAMLFRRTGQYDAARPLYETALEIREKALGPDSPEVASILNNFATLFLETGDHAAARGLYERALEIRESRLGPDHPDVAQSLNNLAILSWRSGDRAQARRLYERALTIMEKSLGPEHPDVALSLNNLGNVLRATGDLAGALPHYRRSLAIREKVLGADHPDVALSLNNLANLYWDRGDYESARPLHERALAIRESAFGPDHPEVAQSLINLGNLRRAAGDYAGAWPYYDRALSIRRTAPQHPEVGVTLHNMACLAALQGNTERALDFVRQALGAGFDRDVIVADPDLASLRGHPEFEALVAPPR